MTVIKMALELSGRLLVLYVVVAIVAAPLVVVGAALYAKPDLWWSLLTFGLGILTSFAARLALRHRRRLFAFGGLDRTLHHLAGSH